MILLFYMAAVIAIASTLLVIVQSNIVHALLYLILSLLALGITISVVLQTAINIAVCTASAPTKGIPLPFISHGSSGTDQPFLQAFAQTLASFKPGVKERLLDNDGEVKRFINVFVDGEEIRGLAGERTELSDNSEVSIIPAMAGGTA